jgi:hypothetical protein
MVKNEEPPEDATETADPRRPSLGLAGEAGSPLEEVMVQDELR